MRKQIYISADYSKEDGDYEVVQVLNGWGNDDKHIVDFVDMSKVVSGSVSKEPDCRPCDLKKEFNRQINASSAVIFVVGNKTAYRTAGSSCSRLNKMQSIYLCTPYKQNTNGYKYCKISSTTTPGEKDDVGEINSYSYLRHEFEQAKKKDKQIVIVYNSTRNELNWLPSYMKGYESNAMPFWTLDYYGRKVGNYTKIKEALGYA